MDGVAQVQPGKLPVPDTVAATDSRGDDGEGGCGRAVSRGDIVPNPAPDPVTGPVAEGGPEREEPHAVHRLREAHDAAPTDLCDVARNIVSVSRLRRARDMSSRSGGSETGEGMSVEPPSYVRIVFPAIYVRNPRRLFDEDIGIARPWRDPDPKVSGKRSSRTGGNVKDKAPGDADVHAMTSKAVLTSVPPRRRDASRKGLFAIAADAGLYIGEENEGGRPRLRHSCFHRDVRERFADGAGSTVFLERLRVVDEQPLAVLVAAGNSIARDCLGEKSKLPTDQLDNLSRALCTAYHALSGSLKGGKSRTRKDSTDPSKRQPELPRIVTVARVWRRDDRKRKHAHNHGEGEGFQRRGKHPSGAKLDVCANAQLVPDMAYMAVEGAYGCLLRSEFRTATVDDEPATPLLPSSVVSVFTKLPRVRKSSDESHAKLGNRGYIFADNIARGTLGMMQAWAIARVLGLVDPAVATEQYCKVGQEMLATGDGRPHYIHRQLFGCPFTGSPRSHRQPTGQRDMRTSALCEVFLLPLSVLSAENYHTYRAHQYTAALVFEGAVESPSARGTLAALLDHYPEAVGDAMPVLRDIFSRVMDGRLGEDSLSRLREWDSANQSPGHRATKQSGHQPQRWDEAENVLRVALGIDNLAKMLVHDPSEAHSFDMAKVPAFMIMALKTVFARLSDRLRCAALDNPVKPRDIVSFLVQPFATFALEWLESDFVPQGCSVMFDFYEASQDVRNGKVLHSQVLAGWARAFGVVDMDAAGDSAPSDSAGAEDDAHDDDVDVAGDNDDEMGSPRSDGVIPVVPLTEAAGGEDDDVTGSPSSDGACPVVSAAEVVGASDADANDGIPGPRIVATAVCEQGPPPTPEAAREHDGTVGGTEVEGGEGDESVSCVLPSPFPAVDFRRDGYSDNGCPGDSDMVMSDVVEVVVDDVPETRSVVPPHPATAREDEPADRVTEEGRRYWVPKEGMAHRMGASLAVDEKTQAHVACVDALKWAVLCADPRIFFVSDDNQRIHAGERAACAMLDRSFQSREHYAQMAASALWSEVEAGIAMACTEAAGRLPGPGNQVPSAATYVESADDETAVVRFRVDVEQTRSVEPTCAACRDRHFEGTGVRSGAPGAPLDMPPMGLHHVRLTIMHGPGYDTRVDSGPYCPHTIAVGKLVRIRLDGPSHGGESDVIGYVEGRWNAGSVHKRHSKGNTSTTPNSTVLTISVAKRVKDSLCNAHGLAFKQGELGSLTPVFLMRPAFAVLRVLKRVEEGRYMTNTAPSSGVVAPRSRGNGRSGTPSRVGAIDLVTTTTGDGFNKALEEKAELMRDPEAFRLARDPTSASHRSSRLSTAALPPVLTETEWLRARVAKNYYNRVVNSDSENVVDEPQRRVLDKLLYCNVKEGDHRDSGHSRPAVVFVRGPPGSGKSAIACRVTNLHLINNHALSESEDVQQMRITNRVLFAAERNSAVDDCLAAIRVESALIDSDGKAMPRPRCLRLGNHKERASPDVRQVHIEWMLDTPMEHWPPEWRRVGRRWQDGWWDRDNDEVAFATLCKLEEDHSRLRKLSAQGECESAVDGWRSRPGSTSSAPGGAHREQGRRSRLKEERMARVKLKAHILSMAHVVGVTIGTMQLGALDHGPPFDHVIFEECSLSAEPSWAYLLFRLFAGQAPRSYLFIGDDAQGRPFSASRIPKARARLTLSPFSRLRVGLGDLAILLTKQYRMHSAIWRVNNDRFYGGEVENGLSDSELACDASEDAFGRFGPVTVLDTSNGAPGYRFEEGRGRESTSRLNYGEARVAVAVLRSLVLSYPERKRVLLLSHYVDQVELIRCMIRNDRILARAGFDIFVQTVDSAQGKQVDFTIYSLTRSHTGQGWDGQRAPRDTLSFINNVHAVNVATTRSRRGLIVIGNVNFIRKNSPIDSCWQHFFTEYEKYGYIRSAKHFERHYGTAPDDEGERGHEMTRCYMVENMVKLA